MVTIRIACWSVYSTTILHAIVAQIPGVVVDPPDLSVPDVLLVSTTDEAGTPTDWAGHLQPEQTLILLDAENNLIHIRRGGPEAVGEKILPADLSVLVNFITQLVEARWAKPSRKGFRIVA